MGKTLKEALRGGGLVVGRLLEDEEEDDDEEEVVGTWEEEDVVPREVAVVGWDLRRRGGQLPASRGIMRSRGTAGDFSFCLRVRVLAAVEVGIWNGCDGESGAG